MVENRNHLVCMENKNSIVKLTFVQTTPTVFSSKSLNLTTLDPANYFIPSASNNPTFDSFFRLHKKGFGVQLTIGKEHGLDKKGLHMLYSRLEDSKEWYFVFVIPPGHQLRCEKPSTLYVAQFKYFVLELPISDGEYIFISSHLYRAFMVLQLQIQRWLPLLKRVSRWRETESLRYHQMTKLRTMTKTTKTIDCRDILISTFRISALKQYTRRAIQEPTAQQTDCQEKANN